MTAVAVGVLALACAGLLAALVLERRRRARTPAPSAARILFPFVGSALSLPALEATLRLAHAERATLVPTYLALVPMHLPLDAPLPRQCDAAMPLLEAVEQRATACGVAVDARIERGRDHRHALREALVHEHFDRVVIAATTGRTDGFDEADIAWLLKNAAGEILVLRPGHDRLLATAPPGRAPARRARASAPARS